MRSVNFKSANDVIGPPRGLTEDQCYSVAVHRGIDIETLKQGAILPSITLCWEFTPEELQYLMANGGKFYQTLYSTTLPMQSMNVVDPVEQQWVGEHDKFHLPMNPSRLKEIP